MNLPWGAEGVLQARLTGLKPVEPIHILAGYSAPFPILAVCYTEGRDWRFLKGLNAMIQARTMACAIPAIMDVLPEAETVEVFDDESLAGFTARIKFRDDFFEYSDGNLKLKKQIPDDEFKREFANRKNPQPSDISLSVWPKSMYIGMGKKNG